MTLSAVAPRPPLKALAWSAKLASIFSLTILCASVAAALPPIANFTVRSPITEEASIPNEQASAQIASHELRARDRLRIITSYKEQDIILAGEGGARMLTGFAPICPALEGAFLAVQALEDCDARPCAWISS